MGKIEKLNLNLEDQKCFNIDPRYKNINKINDVFLNCYYDTVDLNIKFQNLINDTINDFSRYTFFYVNYLIKKKFKN